MHTLCLDFENKQNLIIKKIIINKNPKSNIWTSYFASHNFVILPLSLPPPSPKAQHAHT
jgi:hypothetical protein